MLSLSCSSFPELPTLIKVSPSDILLDELAKETTWRPYGVAAVGLYYYKWHSKTLTFSKHLIAENVGTGLFIQTADLDKNGLKDIVVAGKSGTYIIFSNK